MTKKQWGLGVFVFETPDCCFVKVKKVKWCIYIAPLSQTSQRRFTMINLPPADWKRIQARMAAASKQSMHAGTHLTDLGRMES